MSQDLKITPDGDLFAAGSTSTIGTLGEHVQHDPLERECSGRLENYLRKARLAGPVTPEQELIVRDAWVAAWRSGGKFALKTSAELARPEFTDSLAMVAAFIKPEAPNAAH